VDHARRVVDDLGDWSLGSGPLFRRLAVSLSRLVERGVLDEGERLPSERALATALSISRGTAVAAYDQLVADGVVERRQGSGTYAVGSAAVGLPAGREGSGLVARLVDASAGHGEVVDLSLSVLQDAGGLPDAQVSTADLEEVAPDTGYSPWGLYGLREALAERLSADGLPSTAEQIVVTTGAQQAISLAAACWVRPGDAVVVDDPTYPGALSAFTAAGARLTTELDGHPALVYAQPSIHSPTGAVLTRPQRDALAASVVERGVPMVEDVALAGLAWDRLPEPVAARIPDHPVAVVGSLSKLLWGGLRLGFVRAPEPVALRFARVKATHDLGTSVVSQLLAERLLRHPGLDAFLAARNRALQARHDVLAAALRERLPTWTWDEPRGGLSVWVRLPEPVAEAFAQRALRQGVAVATAEALSAEPRRHRDRLRLSFAAAPHDLAEGVRRLAAAWAAPGAPPARGSRPEPAKRV
jgi:DNA-binding transcriptional MocR family regulator